MLCRHNGAFCAQDGFCHMDGACFRTEKDETRLDKLEAEVVRLRKRIRKLEEVKP